jgi:Mg2+/Co2+ transporter CorB
MLNLSLGTLSFILVLLVLASAFFSAAETAMMRLNRYRLRHLVQAKHKGAVRAQRLLERPDRLIGFILLGNNFVNIFASSIATIIALETFGQAWIGFAAGLLTLVILIFGEVTPKTLAVLHPERIAFPASLVLEPLMALFYPLVWVINTIANGLLRAMGISIEEEAALQPVTVEELRTVVNESGALIPRRHQRMLLSILDLEKATVDDIMVPRNDIVGIDIASGLDEIVEKLSSRLYTRLPVYREDIDDVIGILHVRSILPGLMRGEITKEMLIDAAEQPYFVPEGTPLNTQLINFQRQKKRIGLVVSEYGDIRGLVTLEDILEEIVGEFTTDIASAIRYVHQEPDGSYLVDGGVNIRVLNRMMNWHLPVRGPKTLNGLILEHLESMPATGTSLRIDDYTIEVVQIAENTVKTARIRAVPPRARGPG